MEKSASGSDVQEVMQPEKVNNEAPSRGKWGSQIEFLMAMISCAIGLGNVWRFPYLCYKNGGGAFLIPYIIMVGIVGLPLFFLETGLGQFSNRSVITVWSLSPLFRGLGYAGLFLIVLVAAYYNVLVAQFIYYLFLSMTDPLPWAGCCDWWGPSDCCRECLNDTLCQPVCQAPNATLSTNCTEYALPAEDFYKRYVLQMSTGLEEFGSPVWQLVLCLLGDWVLVTLGVLFGAASFGKAAYFTAIFPYVMLVIMLIRGVTLEGSWEGIVYYIVPRIDRLLDVNTWLDAAGQVFFSIGAANFMLVVLASYNDFRHPLLRDSLVVITLDMCTSIFSGFVVFSVLGYMAHEKGVLVEDVVTSGPSLVFETYPTALATMPVSQLWSILFFLMMITLGIGSSFSYVESILLTLQDLLDPVVRMDKTKKTWLRIIVCFVMFLIGLPMTCNGGIYLLTLIDISTGTFGLLILGCTECVVLSWVYGWKRLKEDIRFMTGNYPNKFFLVCWTVVTPAVLLVVLIMSMILYQPPVYEDYEYPAWAHAIAFSIMLSPLFFIPLGALIHLLYKSKIWVIVAEAARPTEDWGPSDPEMRRQYNELMPRRLMKVQTNESIGEKYKRAMFQEHYQHSFGKHTESTVAIMELSSL